MRTKGIALMLPCLALTFLFPQTSQAIALVTKAAETIESSAPICEIEAIVYSAKTSKSDPNYYDVQLKVTGIGTFKTQADDPCDNGYIGRLEKNGQILSASEYKLRPIKRGDTIKALATFDESGITAGYFLYDIQITGKTKLLSQGNNPEITYSISKYTELPYLIAAFLSIIILGAMAYVSRKKI